MKIVITTSGPGWSAAVDQRFGRAAGFAVVELDSLQDEPEYVANVQDTQAHHGAGIQAAETVVRHGAHEVLTGHVGPKAFRALHAAQVGIWLGVQGTVRQAVDDYVNGRLRKAQEADSEGHA